MENKIKKLLLELHIDPHLSGFGYLVDAIGVCYSNHAYAKGITTLLYPYVAEKNKTTPSRVDRNMRNAVEKSANSCDNINEILMILPSYSTGNYTNSQFICACVEKLKMEGQNV